MYVNVCCGAGERGCMPWHVWRSEDYSGVNVDSRDQTQVSRLVQQVYLYPLNHLSGPSFLFKKKKVSAHSENFTDIESYTLEYLRLYGRALPLHTPSGNLWKFLPVSIQHFFLMSMQTNNSKHSFFLFQENSQMFQGRPCKDMSILNEYFPHGITNGASWYNVPGKDHSLTTWIFLFSRVLLLVNDLFQFWERTIVFFFLKKAQMI